MPTISLWASHPFSIAWADIPDTWTSAPSESPSTSPSPRFAESTEDVELGRLSSTTPTNALQDSTSISSHQESEDVLEKTISGGPQAQTTKTEASARRLDVTASNSFSLIIRARTGMTRQLYEKALASECNTFTTKGLIEGPYGAHISVNSYGTIVLFAGGVGITHCIGMARHLIREFQSGDSSTRKIRLVWSIQSTEMLTWVRDWIDEIMAMNDQKIFSIDVFATTVVATADVPQYNGMLQLASGRCDPLSILKEEMENRVGALFVTVCGPGAFADDVRAATRSQMSGGALDFVEEAFTY
jgi:NAD(P)H-flavin reductase